VNVRHALPLGAALLVVQAVPASSRLPAADAVLDAEFTRIVAVRELADGRVLVSDAGDRKLFVADFTRQDARPIGREGQGPGEYRSVGQLLPLAGDSTLLVDGGAGRWLLLANDSIVATVAADAPAIREGARLPLGADARGNVLASRGMGGAPGAIAISSGTDSTWLLRVSRRTGTADTIARLMPRPARITIQGPQDRPTGVSIMVNPLAAGDLATMFPDGSVTIARVRPYRVDRVAPDGRLTPGPDLPFSRTAVTMREKEAVMRRAAEASGREPNPVESVGDWPDELPPFLTGALLSGRDGRTWILRTRSAAAPEARYDVVDPAGRLIARYVLPPNESIVGFGREVIYSILTDEDGLQHLRRHRMR